MLKSHREKQASEALPEMVRVARRVHKTFQERRTAVLLAWVGLAGIVGWTPAMVKRVEALVREER